MAEDHGSKIECGARESTEATSELFRPTMRLVEAFASGDIFSAKEGSVRYAPGVKEENLKLLRERFKTFPGDIFIYAFPKSGTTWTQQIVKLVLNNGIEDSRDIEEHTLWVDQMKMEEVEDKRTCIRIIYLYIRCSYKIIITGQNVELPTVEFVYER